MQGSLVWLVNVWIANFMFVYNLQPCLQPTANRATIIVFAVASVNLILKVATSNWCMTAVTKKIDRDDAPVLIKWHVTSSSNNPCWKFFHYKIRDISQSFLSSHVFSQL